MKKLFSFLAILMVAVTSWAENVLNVNYIDSNGKEQTCAVATVITSSTGYVELLAGWYVVQGTDITIADGITCTDDVHLILADGAKLTIGTTTDDRTALYVISGKTLEILGQYKDTGTLIATSGSGRAGIGGGGDIIINGGTIQATGGLNAAGIGSGYNLACGTITINGGNVTANGGGHATGIGGASQTWCGDITINGGNVTANGGIYGAAIGSGHAASCGKITINGGYVSAKADIPLTNAIGAGNNGQTVNSGCSGVYVTTDATVYAGTYANPSGTIENDGSDIQSKLQLQYAIIKPGFRFIDAEGKEQVCHDATVINSTDSHVEWAAGWYAVTRQGINLTGAADCAGDVHLILTDKAKMTITDSSCEEDGFTALHVGDGNTLQIYGQKNNAGTLVATSVDRAGIGGEGTALIINGGTIQATGSAGSAGIGASINESFGTISINGGNVSAIGGEQAAGIGNGAVTQCGNITINGGNVTAKATTGHSAIGTGNKETSGSVIINSYEYVYGGSAENPQTQIENDGTTDLSSSLTQQYVDIRINPKYIKYIDAKGDEQTCYEVTRVQSYNGHVDWAAGWYALVDSDVEITDGVTCTGDVHLILADGAKLTIGTTTSESRRSVFIDSNSNLQIYGQANNSGTLLANTTSQFASAIGGEGKSLVINGGTIIANGGLHGSGIGPYGFNFGTITINGGNITATGGYKASGIGGSVTGITINGGNITAVGGTYSSGIGDWVAGKICINGGMISAMGSVGYPGIGRGTSKVCGDIYISTNLAVLTDDVESPTTVLENTGASLLDKFKRYVSIYPNYLCFAGEEDGTIEFDKVETNHKVTATLEYSRNAFTSGSEWYDYTFATPLKLAKDAKIYFRAKGTNGKNQTFCLNKSEGIKFSSTAKVAAGGNIMSLLSSNVKSDLPNFAFANLFNGCTNLTSTPSLPATSMAKGAYYGMFFGCTSLTSLPSLPATNLADSCYLGMFEHCTGLYINKWGLGTEWSIPASYEEEDWGLYMFLWTSGNKTSAPELGTTYYVANSETTYTRSKATGLYGTICLPYNYSVTGAKLYSADFDEKKTAILLTEVETPVAGTPYIYQATADEQVFSLTNGKIVTEEPVDALPLVGVFEDTKAIAGTYVMQTVDGAQAFYTVNAGSEPTVNAFKAYMTAGGSTAKKITIGFNDDVDGISEVSALDALTSGTAKIYDLSGRKLSTLHKGVNIVNGKKVIVK